MSPDAEQFEEHRGRLRAVAHRMLGPLAEADDAVQDTWLKYNAADVGEVRSLGGRLTTVLCILADPERTARLALGPLVGGEG
ncbi:sigma factor [Streptomyces sp. NPDC088789]|uniref:sigma factor n=1 Tax=Streptomyces sp. NPDC088789 TaxID=3365899 RepID=UPI00382E7BDE